MCGSSAASDNFDLPLVKGELDAGRACRCSPCALLFVCVCVGVCLNTLDGTVKASFNVYLER